MFGGLVDYWYYTGDDQYNDITAQALEFQVGDDQDYMPTNQTGTMSNDDQCLWALSALQAAEHDFQKPSTKGLDWTTLAQNVFDDQSKRWDTSKCDGGLRWQIFAFDNGYTYKNTVTNGCFFNLAARLGKLTGDQKYLDWAQKTWDWIDSSELEDKYHFYEGAYTKEDCKDPNPIEYSINSGLFLHGAAVMANVTGDKKWQKTTDGILEVTLDRFFETSPKDVMYEWSCEEGNTCDVDQRAYKALLARSMRATTEVAPSTADSIMPKLEASAKYAAMQCSGGQTGDVCGTSWTDGDKYDGTRGVGNQLSAMEIFQSNLASAASSSGSDDSSDNSSDDSSDDKSDDKDDKKADKDAAKDDKDAEKDDDGNMAAGTSVGMGLLMVGAMAATLGQWF
jgi:mannan endo-1,6-alpha-mannosidase